MTWNLNNRDQFQYPLKRIITSRIILNPEIRFQCSCHFEMWQVSHQKCYWDVCQISEQLENSKLWCFEFETLWVLKIRCLWQYWNDPPECHDDLSHSQYVSGTHILSLQTSFNIASKDQQLNASPRIKIIVFRCKFHWKGFVQEMLITDQHWLIHWPLADLNILLDYLCLS